ncbi:hypothetical protein PTTG_06050 [Puccinia triticina 1-1 BBBD Race 1]|uniref:Major facilitator superfamily (MFS) profile domain-containing protein n=2 Tax=Puccinia triticina TaxID=208348 RepID=A0A180GV32_PUCT1|nr:uncharacterized protein PtA15_1A775 [Puccinia triticina]OAV96635.1 hypothetical protein PTTG_06050 [Puccinia triticina 1-1 BBBD Race 1]WAQ81434.1 hypothetical protein PtA15_1A775 [Puccinia triticina]WAR52317.1 hypothetical protein PtB15_1B758 [Puccinia triticina]
MALADTDPTPLEPIPEPAAPQDPLEEVVLPTPAAPFHPAALFRRPFLQVVIISMVCFCCPGMFNALSGLGGGGQIDPTTADNANVALYSTFALTAFGSGSFVNLLGPRLSLTIGSVGYTLFIGSYLSYNINQNSGFVIAAGALLGVCAGLLWTAQGSLMLAYATEATKGRYIAAFWIIFNLGAVLGEAVALGKNYNDTTDSPVSNGVYIAFLIITLIGTFLTFTLARPSSITRTDGSLVTVERNPDWKHELRAMFRTLTQDPTILLLFPFFWASNWFYTYQFNDYNLALFNLRTRSLNALLYWLSQIFGSGLFGLLLDYERAFKRQQRAGLGWAILTAVIFLVWGFGWDVQKDYERGSLATKMDWNDSGYLGRVWLYIFYGVTDSMWQTYAYWIMGMLADDPRDLAPLVGFYKGIQSAGAAVIFRIDSNQASYHAIFISSWGILALGLFCLIPLLLFRIKNDEMLPPRHKVPQNHQPSTTFKLEKQSV